MIISSDPYPKNTNQNATRVYDSSGRLYAGMTLQEAKLKGCDKSFWKRDFRDVDKDRDGVLSTSEIMNERNKMANRCKWGGLFMSALTTYDLLRKGSRWGKVFDLVFDALLLYQTFGGMHEINKGTEKYRQMLANKEHIDTNV